MSALDDLVAAVAAQTAIIDAELADPTARLKAASLAMKVAAAAATGFTALGVLDHMASSQMYVLLFPGASISVNDVLTTRSDFTASDDAGTATVSAVNSPGLVFTVAAAGGWTPVEGHIVGIG